jgi:hypothetical protein
LLRHREGLPPDVQKNLEAIHRACIRIRDIVRRLEDLREDRTVEYIPGVQMTDLRGEEAGGNEGRSP